MWSGYTLLSVFLLLLTGCNQATQSVAQVAENTRSATERMALRSEERNAQREIELHPNVGEFRKPQGPLFVERYETREGPDGLFIYDTETQSIARIGSQAQSGLSYEQAQAAFDALSAADASGALP